MIERRPLKSAPCLVQMIEKSKAVGVPPPVTTATVTAVDDSAKMFE
jgi:hypothetical protein